MLKYEDEIENYIPLINKLKEKFDGYYKEDNDNDLFFHKTDGKVTLDEETLKIKGSALEQEAKKIIKQIKQETTLTEEEQRKLILKEEQVDYPTQKRKLYEISEELRKAKIKKVINKEINAVKDTLYKTPTIVLIKRIRGTQANEEKDLSKEQTKLKKKYGKELDTKNLINPFHKEKYIDIKYGNIVIGQYFPKRNFIGLNINPFNLEKQKLLTPITADLKNFLKDLQKLKIKKEDIKEINEKLFLEGYFQKLKKRKYDNKEKIKEHDEKIKKLNTELKDTISEIINLSKEQEYLDQRLEQGKEILQDEIKKTNKLPFIKSIEFKGEDLVLGFVPTHITINNFTRGAKSFGKRTMWLGEIKLMITPDGLTAISNEQHLNGNAHPHGNSSMTTICMGEGAGKEKIYEFVETGKISDLAKMLWFWLKTYISDSAYISQSSWYDDRLKQGYPVWDENGEQISINDKERIRTGEQQELEKHDNYEENKKKFAGKKVSDYL